MISVHLRIADPVRQAREVWGLVKYTESNDFTMAASKFVDYLYCSTEKSHANIKPMMFLFLVFACWNYPNGKVSPAQHILGGSESVALKFGTDLSYTVHSFTLLKGVNTHSLICGYL